MKTTATVRSYADALAFLNGRESRKIAHNTYIEKRATGDIAVRYHATDVVTYNRNGAIVLKSGGWQTVTTKARLNAFSPASVFQKQHAWFVSNEANLRAEPFYDGINVAVMEHAATA